MEFECVSCGGTWEVSIRYAREIRRLGLTQICQPCRIPIQVIVTPALEKWWRSNFTQPEIDQLAYGLYGHFEASTDGVMQTNLVSILTSAADQQVTFPDH